MDNRYDISLPRPRRPVAPPCAPPPHCHPPAPPNQNIINVNVAPSDSTGVALQLGQVISDVQSLTNRLNAVEGALESGSFGGVELGEISGTAYPGDKGAANRVMLDYVMSQMGSFVTDEDMIGYATVSGVTESFDSLRADIDNRLSGSVDSGVVSSVVSSVISNYAQSNEGDYSTLLSSINGLNSELDASRAGA